MNNKPIKVCEKAGACVDYCWFQKYYYNKITVNLVLAEEYQIKLCILSVRYRRLRSVERTFRLH